MDARLSSMKERIRRWLWGDGVPRPKQLPEDIEHAFRRLDRQQQALHEAVVAMHERRGGKEDWWAS